MGRLALELGVTRRTIRSDITALTVDYPLETQRGNGGCVKVYPVLNGKTRHCRKCAPHSGGYPEPDLVGKTLNGWSIINKENKVRTSNGWIYYFRCQCLRCGNESVLNAGQIYNSKSSRCGKCGPMYHFRIYGNSAF